MRARVTGAPALAELVPVAPEEAGFDRHGLAAAVDYVRAHESAMDRDIGRALTGGHFSEPLPDGDAILVLDVADQATE